MKRTMFGVLLVALMATAGVVSAELMKSEKLVLALLQAHPEVNPQENIFLAWRGLEYQEMNQFDLVLLVREDRILVITDSPKLIKIFKSKKKRKWDLAVLENGEVILTMPKPKGSIEDFLEKRFELRILTKTTLTPA